MTSVRENYTIHVPLKIKRQEIPKVKEQQNKCTMGNKATCVMAREENVTNREGEKVTKPYSVDWN